MTDKIYIYLKVFTLIWFLLILNGKTNNLKVFSKLKKDIRKKNKVLG